MSLKSMKGFLVFVTTMLAGLPVALAYAEDNIGPGIDSDSDGLSDVFERRIGTDPTQADTDKDGLFDGLEYTGGNSGTPTDPASADTDRDGLLDGFEISKGINPVDVDSDNDGLADASELSVGTDPSTRDTDHDGLSDSLELAQGINPLATDTDSDGVKDSIEVWHGTDPLDGQSFFVLPESPIGPVALVSMPIAALALFLARAKSSHP